MVPSASDIARNRHLIRGFVAVSGIMAVVAGAGLLVRAVVTVAYLYSQTGNMMAGGFGPMFFLQMVMPALFLLAGVLAYFRADQVARIVTPVSRVTMCPRCSFELVRNRSLACPECGLPLTDEFVEPEHAAPPAP